MKLASWNINSLRKRQDRLLEWLAEKPYDVVCLQETKCSDDQFPEMSLAAAGYRAVFHGQKSYNGVAILARGELLGAQPSLCDKVIDDQARVIAATFRRLRIFCIYAPNGQAVGLPAFAYKLQWFARLRDCVSRARKTFTDVIICGDFNVAPEDRDVHDPALWEGAIMCSQAERGAFAALEELGLRDTLRIHRPEPGLFTWWDYRMLAFPKNRGLRIDGILASNELAARCVAAGIDRDMRKGKDPSDHAPIWAEFGDVTSD
ncbi:MAG: exodeoxyribonuclease III [Chthoniobacterales bacterium]|nr:MAG: exodeoxyribonuclease III [Chthoniobacterales bacterium]